MFCFVIPDKKKKTEGGGVLHLPPQISMLCALLKNSMHLVVNELSKELLTASKFR